MQTFEVIAGKFNVVGICSRRNSAENASLNCVAVILLLVPPYRMKYLKESRHHTFFQSFLLLMGTTRSYLEMSRDGRIIDVS
jgi:hypothetical protein